jgi:hypothetical protein
MRGAACHRGTCWSPAHGLSAWPARDDRCRLDWASSSKNSPRSIADASSSSADDCNHDGASSSLTVQSYEALSRNMGPPGRHACQDVGARTDANLTSAARDVRSRGNVSAPATESPAMNPARSTPVGAATREETDEKIDICSQMRGRMRKHSDPERGFDAAAPALTYAAL